MIKINETNNSNPICPHCEKEIKIVNSQKLDGLLGVRYIYFCSECHKVLGMSHRKGFWMG